MEVKFDIIRPNLYVVEDRVYFGIDSSDVIQAGRAVDKVISDHIGVLKVKRSDLDVIQSGKNVKPEKNDAIPLRKYLDALVEVQDPFGKMVGVTDDAAKLFGLDYVVSARTIASIQDIDNWMQFQHDLTNPNETFDRVDKENLVYRLDREKTLAEMEKLYKELDEKIPDDYAGFMIINGLIASSKQKLMIKNFGVVYFEQLKAKDRTKIEEAKNNLTGELKKFDGPCLSFDAPLISDQMIYLYKNAPTLIQNCGDVLTDPMWKRRFFRLDP